MSTDALPDPDFTPEVPLASVPRFCLRCRARLDDPTSGKMVTACPRCGLPHDPARPETFSKRPRPHQWALWSLCLLVAVAAGVLTYARQVDQDQLGAVAFIIVPFSIGGFLGFATRAKFWLVLLSSLLAIACIVFILISMSLSGLFCGMMLGAVFFAPALVGACFGWMIRQAVNAAAYDRRRFVLMTLFLGLPFGAEKVEDQWPIARPIDEVSTSTTFGVSAPETWRAIHFYEQVEHAPPFLLTLALPRPLRVEGSKAAVGDVARCVYEQGYLVKQVTAHDEPRLLAFDVTEQHLHFEHDVALLDGSFILQPVGPGQTRVVLTTRYRPLLRPAWLWGPMERKIIHTLHEHVLEGMRRRTVEP